MDSLFRTTTDPMSGQVRWTAPRSDWDTALQAAVTKYEAILCKMPLVGNGHPITSHQMAAKLAGSGITKHRGHRLLLAMHDSGGNGMTDDELIVRFIHWPQSTVTSIMSQLRKHHIVAAGPDTRKTRFGNAAMVNRLAVGGAQ
jgi:hypothetical protein